jgi:hypothetical protein
MQLWTHRWCIPHSRMMKMDLTAHIPVVIVIMICVAQCHGWDHELECAGKASSNKEGTEVGWLEVGPKKWVFR